MDNTRNPRYLGDVLTALLEKTGVAPVVRAVEKVTGKDCGCKKRQQALNEWHQQHQAARAARRER
jgi:hypothetical protein